MLLVYELINSRRPASQSIITTSPQELPQLEVKGKMSLKE